MLVGCLAAAAIGVQLAVPGSAGRGGTRVVPRGLLTAYGWWLLAGAAVAVAVALGRSARKAPRHVARGDRSGAKVRPVSG
jgi:hypothetical protein